MIVEFFNIMMAVILETIDEIKIIKNTVLLMAGIISMSLMWIAFFIVLCLVLFAFFFGALFLPFNNKDLRPLCALTLFVDVSIICYATSSNLGNHSTWPDYLISLYFFIWAIYIYVVSRNHNYDYLMPDEQTSQKPACLSAAASVICVFLAIRVFSIPWQIAYSYSVPAVCLLAPIVINITSHSKKE